MGGTTFKAGNPKRGESLAENKQAAMHLPPALGFGCDMASCLEFLLLLP